MKKQNVSLSLYRKMFLIRSSEEAIRQKYHEDEMKTPVHLAIGEEAIAAGVCQGLNAKDKIFATYRNHGIYLARTEETDLFFGELYGRVSGMFRGKGGSMHISSPKAGFLGTSAVVSTTIPVALGCAFTQKTEKSSGFSVVFFGDGAIDEGVFWESVNFACLKRLPVIFVCEDNGLAIHSSAKSRHGYESIAKIISEFNCNVLESKTTDAEEIHKMLIRGKKLHNKNGKPVFLCLSYYRYLEHVGINTDFQFGYRKESDFKKWQKIDPLAIMRAKVLKSGVSEEKVRKIESFILRKIEAGIVKAKKAPYANESEVLKNVYSV